MVRAKKFIKTGLGLTASAATLGIGASLSASVGGDTAGLANLSRGLPAVGTISAAGFTLGALGDLARTTKKLRRR